MRFWMTFSFFTIVPCNYTHTHTHYWSYKVWMKYSVSVISAWYGIRVFWSRNSNYVFSCRQGRWPIFISSSDNQGRIVVCLIGRCSAFSLRTVTRDFAMAHSLCCLHWYVWSWHHLPKVRSPRFLSYLVHHLSLVPLNLLSTCGSFVEDGCIFTILTCNFV